jgi:HEAT repeat protein
MVARAALVLLALVAIPSCGSRTGPDPQEVVAEHLTEVLAAAESDDPAEALALERWLAEDPDRQVRAMAAEVLGRPEPMASTVEALAGALRDSDPLVRTAAALALQRAAPERAVQEALRTGPSDPSDRAAWAAVRLGELEEGDPRRVEAAATLLALVDEALDPLVRARALEALGRVGPPVAARGAARALEDDHWEVRAAAAGALARLAPRESETILRRLAEDDQHRTVRQRARQALKEIEPARP